MSAFERTIAPTAQLPSPTHAVPKTRVLVCDDDIFVQQFLASLIASDESLELVGIASSTSQGLELAEQTLPDVAILDVDIPEQGGIFLARELRRVTPHTRVLALSGSTNHDTVVGMMAAGAIGYLVKGDSSAILQVLHTIETGHTVLSPQLGLPLLNDFMKLRTKSREDEEDHQRKRHVIESVFTDPEILQIVGQPIRQLDNGQLVGFEALSRFHHAPPRGPDRWFKAASDAGMLKRLEILAVRRAFARMSEIPEPAYLSVNVSPTTATSAEFLKLLRNAACTRIVVEITEHAEISDYQRFRTHMDSLRELGAKVAVDDAGAGFASLRHILEIQPEFIKIDNSLISGIHLNTGQQALTRGLISFANSIDATIIAEGIETLEELTVLEELGIRFGQGYYLGRPSPSFNTMSALVSPAHDDTAIRPAEVTE